MQENTLVEFKRWMRIIGKDNNQIKSNLEQIELTLKSLSYEEKRIQETINFVFDNIKNEDLPKQVALKKYNLENLLIKAMDYLIQQLLNLEINKNLALGKDFKNQYII